MQANVIALVKVDAEGYPIESVLFSPYDENGEPIEIPSDLVLPNQKSIYKPRWDFNLQDWVEDDPERALFEEKRKVIWQYETECTQLIEKGFEHNGDFFRFLKDPDQDNFTQQLIVLVASMLLGTPLPDKPIEWKTENNGVKLFTKEEFFAICQTGQVHKTSNMSAKWQLIDYINNSVHDLETLHSLGSFETAKNIVL
jgi:hypothetical protein